MFADLQCLGNAVKNKETYLQQNQVLLSQNEAKHPGDFVGNSRLIQAIKRKESKLALDFISRGLYITKLGQGGRTPLMYAAEVGLDDVVQALLPFSELNIKASSRTALFFAVLNDHQSTSTLLVLAGAKIDVKITSGTAFPSYTIEEMAQKKGIDLSTTLTSVSSRVYCQ